MLFGHWVCSKYFRAGQVYCEGSLSFRVRARSQPWLPSSCQVCTRTALKSGVGAIDLPKRTSSASRGRRLTRKHLAGAEAGASSESKGKRRKSKGSLSDTPDSGKAIQGPLGYTPFEYVTFGDNQLTHELSIEV